MQLTGLNLNAFPKIKQSKTPDATHLFASTFFARLMRSHNLHHERCVCRYNKRNYFVYGFSPYFRLQTCTHTSALTSFIGTAVVMCVPMFLYVCIEQATLTNEYMHHIFFVWKPMNAMVYNACS